MYESRKLLLITFLSILAIILVLAVALRMQARSYSHFSPLDDEHATFVSIATESESDTHNDSTTLKLINEQEVKDVTKTFNYKDFNRVDLTGCSV